MEALPTCFQLRDAVSLAFWTGPATIRCWGSVGPGIRGWPEAPGKRMLAPRVNGFSGSLLQRLSRPLCLAMLRPSCRRRRVLPPCKAAAGTWTGTLSASAQKMRQKWDLFLGHQESARGGRTSTSMLLMKARWHPSPAVGPAPRSPSQGFGPLSLFL